MDNKHVLFANSIREFPALQDPFKRGINKHPNWDRLSQKTGLSGTSYDLILIN